MACLGYEHGSSVVLLESVPRLGLERGLVGVVRRVDPDRHRVDVEFPNRGVIRALDAHIFAFARGATTT